MTEARPWMLPALAEALDVPAETLRAFARLRGIGWDAMLSAPDAAALALAWIASEGSTAAGPIADAAEALLDSVAGAPA